MTFMPQHFTVWMEIPVTDLDAAIAFYSAVTGGSLSKQEMGPNTTAVFQTADPGAGIAGHLYVGAPATDGRGPTIHIVAKGKLEATIDRVWDAGGKVLGEPISIPAGRFVYMTDPDGNSIGLFEPQGS